MDNPIVHWKGKSGTSYGYQVIDIKSGFKDEPGNYIYAKKEGTKENWVAVYIGQTSSLDERLSSHNEETCVKNKGATHIHAHINKDGESARKEEEKDLIKAHNPPCNEHHT